MDTAVWIDRTSALAEQLAELGPGPLALDTEADSFYHYREKLCLVQLSFAGRDLLVDPLAGVDLDPLADALADGQMRKILHGADYDLRLIDREAGLRISGLFDTMVAARLVGERAFGLASLLARHLDVRLDKKFQRADWSKRPLSPEMRAYAAMDTRYLEQLANLLEERLESLGRVSWAQEEFRRVEQVRFAAPDPTIAFLRVKGSNRLDRRGLGILRSIHAWREERGQRIDRPVFHVLRDDALLELVRCSPKSVAELKETIRLPRNFRPRDAESLLDALAHGRALPEEELPEVPRRERKRLDRATEARLKELARRRDRVAEELDLEASVVAPRAALESALAHLDAGRQLGDVPELRSWQSEVLAPAFQS